jgi:hypothetical protein
MTVPVSVTKVEIGVSATEGQHLDLMGIEYAGDRPMRHCGWEIIVGLNEDEYPALFLQDVQPGGKKAVVVGGENNPIGYFAITQKYAEGQTRTITYESGKTYVAGASTKPDSTSRPNIRRILSRLCRRIPSIHIRR